MRARAVQRLLAIDAVWAQEDCRRLALTGAAACILFASGDSPDELARERIEQLVSIEGLDNCDKPARAVAIADRAGQHYQHKQWKKAGEDWDSASQLDPRRNAYLLNWAEALLRQRHERDDVAILIRKRLIPTKIKADQLSRAAFLRWAATQERDDAQFLHRLYEKANDGEEVLLWGEVERAVCEKLGKDVCRVYDILTTNKDAAQRDQLRELLSPAGGD
jgi:hypothetical protein